jgi:hypothetical protein
VQKYGEAILVLGTRKAESQKRAATIEKHAARRARDRLVPHASLPNSLVYTPIEDWNNDDVWLYLMQVKNPWGHEALGWVAEGNGVQRSHTIRRGPNARGQAANRKIGASGRKAFEGLEGEPVDGWGPVAVLVEAGGLTGMRFVPVRTRT